MKDNLLVGISIGDPNGIGPEVILKALSKSSIVEKITPVLYCNERILSFYEKHLNVSLNYVFVDSPSSAIKNKINIVSFEINSFEVRPGEVNKEAGEIAFKSLNFACNDLLNKETDVIVTAPINKDNIQNKKFNFMGHTEYLTSKCKQNKSLMLMAHNNLRVGLVTNHVPVNHISKNISQENILEKLTLFHNTLKKDFNLKNPKIALLGLNPHAGDNGLIGSHENNIIIPTIEKANQDGILSYGPFPADGFFANKNYKNYDGVLAMYHDQGLIPFKVISNNNGVNFTAGLKIIRTSPDHGTGYDIAGKNIASSVSFENALLMAKDIYFKR